MAAESPMGSAVIARMNRIHGHYAISDDDFNSVLSTFVAEPIRWLERPVPLLEGTWGSGWEFRASQPRGSSAMMFCQLKLAVFLSMR